MHSNSLNCKSQNPFKTCYYRVVSSMSIMHFFYKLIFPMAVQDFFAHITKFVHHAFFHYFLCKFELINIVDFIEVRARHGRMQSTICI